MPVCDWCSRMDEPLERSAGSFLGYSGVIERYGGTAELIGGTRARPPRPRRPRTAPREPEVELLERDYVDYRVELGSGARRTILETIKAVQRAHGDVEVGGWLLSQYRPRADVGFCTISHALPPDPDARVGGTSFEFGRDAIDAMVTARTTPGLERRHVVGDWHTHTVPGSQLPSLQDARAWCGTMDRLARTRYVSLIVAPSESGGWSFPHFSAWVAGRGGVPSRPIVGRARMS